MWKNILQYGGAGMSTVGSAMAMTGYGTIPGIILMGLGAGATAGSQFINTNNSVNQVPVNISNSILTDPPKMANGVVIDTSSLPQKTLSGMPNPYSYNVTNPYDYNSDGNMFDFMKSYGTNSGKPFMYTSNITPTLPVIGPIGDIDRSSIGITQPTNKNNVMSFSSKLMGMADNIPRKKTNVPTGINYYDKYNKMVKDANVYNAIGAGIGIAGNALGLINEINAKKTEDVMAPSMSDTRLDKDQSTFVNFMLRSLETSRNAGYRNAVDMGADPIMTSMMLHSANNMGKLQVMAQAEQQRQQIAATEAQINAQKETTAAQLKANVDQFNIQKQINENESSSKNIIGSIMGIAAGLTSYGQAKLTNSLFADEMMMRIRKSMQQ